MSAGISITERAGLLRVKVTGRRDADNIRSCWLKVGQACLGRNIKGVLFESYLSGTMPESDMFQVAERWQEYGLSGLKIALVHLEQASFSISVFGTTVAQNRGMAVKLFADVETADKWLSQSV